MRDICERCRTEFPEWTCPEVIEIKVGNYIRRRHLCTDCAKGLRDIVQEYLTDSVKRPESMGMVTHPVSIGDNTSWTMTTYPNTGDNAQMYIDSPDRTV